MYRIELWVIILASTFWSNNKRSTIDVFPFKTAKCKGVSFKINLNFIKTFKLKNFINKIKIGNCIKKDSYSNYIKIISLKTLFES